MQFEDVKPIETEVAPFKNQATIEEHEDGKNSHRFSTINMQTIPN
jgi:hypothetical protein